MFQKAKTALYYVTSSWEKRRSAGARASARTSARLSTGRCKECREEADNSMPAGLEELEEVGV